MATEISRFQSDHTHAMEDGRRGNSVAAGAAAGAEPGCRRAAAAANCPLRPHYQARETLVAIASLYGVSVQDLRAANQLSNRAAVTSCTPNNDSTQARGTVRLNGRPAGGYGVVFSWQPDGNVVARTSSGGGGEFDFILHGAGPRVGDWWFWVENGAGNRISEMAHVHTDKDPHTGKCQRAVIGFDIGNPQLTYIGRRLQIPLGRNPPRALPAPPPTTPITS